MFFEIKFRIKTQKDDVIHNDKPVIGGNTVFEKKKFKIFFSIHFVFLIKNPTRYFIIFLVVTKVKTIEI